MNELYMVEESVSTTALAGGLDLVSWGPDPLDYGKNTRLSDSLVFASPEGEVLAVEEVTDHLGPHLYVTVFRKDRPLRGGFSKKEGGRFWAPVHLDGSQEIQVDRVCDAVHRGLCLLAE